MSEAYGFAGSPLVYGSASKVTYLRCGTQLNLS